MVEDLYKLISQVDFDPGQEDWFRFPVEVVVVEECQLPRPNVNFDEVGFLWVSIPQGSALDVNAKDRGKAI